MLFGPAIMAGQPLPVSSDPDPTCPEENHTWNHQEHIDINNFHIATNNQIHDPGFGDAGGWAFIAWLVGSCYFGLVIGLVWMRGFGYW